MLIFTLECLIQEFMPCKCPLCKQPPNPDADGDERASLWLCSRDPKGDALGDPCRWALPYLYPPRPLQLTHMPGALSVKMLSGSPRKLDPSPLLQTTHFIYLLTAGGRQPALSHMLPWLYLPCHLFSPTPYYLVSSRVWGLHSSLLPTNSLDTTCNLANLYLGQVMYWGNGLQCSEDQFPHL